MQVTLLAPGLSEVLQRLSLRPALLAKARRFPVSLELEALKFQLVCTAVPPQGLPIAAVTALEEGLDARLIWMRADPLHLTVDLAHIYHLERQSFVFSEEEVLVLVSLISPLLEGLGLVLHAYPHGRWYLECARLPEINTFSPQAFLGKTITDFFPKGPEQPVWRRLFTEIQMVLQDCSVNRRRRSLGQPTVDALWFWGNGLLLDQTARPPYDCIVGDDEILLGLARYYQLDRVQVVGDFFLTELKECEGHTQLLACQQKLFDRAQPPEHLAAGVCQYFSSLTTLLRHKKLSRLWLYPGDKHCYDVSAQDLAWWKFWNFF